MSSPTLPLADTNTVAAAAPSTIHDVASMMSHCANDMSIAVVAVTAGLDGFAIEMTGLRRSLAVGDAPTGRRHAHTVKGMASTFGAAPCAALAKRIEHLLADADIAAAATALPELEGEVSRLVTVLGEWLRAART